MNITPDDADAAVTAHAQAAPGTTVGSPSADAPQKKKGGRPKLKPGEKGNYKKREPKPKTGGPLTTVLSKREQRIADAEERRRTNREKNTGWDAVGGWKGTPTRTPTVLREKAREVLAELGYPELANIVRDPDAKDSDKLRAIDILGKIGVGYMTPELAGGEDAPDLPPPIINTTDGPLPGEDRPDLMVESEATTDPDGMLPGESRGEPQAGVVKFPQHATDGPSGEPSGPVPHMSLLG